MMDKTFKPAEFEEAIYVFWEKNNLFAASIDRKKQPFSIILPPPNANGALHLGHAMFVFEDALIRYYKLRGSSTLWLPGIDHAGIETQFVYEKELAKKGKSRFDFSREELYKMIWDFTQANKPNIVSQLKKLGFALDWSKEKFTLDEDIIQIVYKTFKQLYDEGLVYRAKRLVNYCTHCGTSFSDLEVTYKEQKDPLYYLKYGPFVLATTRPETKFGDTAVAVNPKDKRYREWVGKEIEVEGLLGKFKMKVIADKSVDPEFGTGVVKVTPAHDFTDFDTGQRHDLEMKQVIDFDGKLNELAGPYKGMRINAARKKILADLQAKSLIVKIDHDYVHRIAVCYRCGTVIEPLPIEQWYIKIKPLADQALKLITKEEIKIYPTKFTKILTQILNNYIDWNISRQIVWGIRIPAWQCADCKKWNITEGKKPSKCDKCAKTELIRDKDTFDTWFSSAQWPFATLQTVGKDYYDYFYPTTVMETGYDILRAWVARMIMIGYFITKQVPFHKIYLHGLVRDKHGQKMSKSKGNVINPLEKIKQFGADAWRASLIFGIADGADVSLSDERIVGMRNFTNKIWNIGRFIWINQEDKRHPEQSTVILSEVKNPVKRKLDSSAPLADQNDRLIELDKEFAEVKKTYIKQMEHYHFSKALETAHEFLWHRFADFYLEELKNELRNGKMEVLERLKAVYLEALKLLHPFMPFVTEAVWRKFNGEESSIMVQKL